MALLELSKTNPDEVVSFSQEFGNELECGGIKAFEYISEIEERIERQSDGFFTVAEAAHVLANSRQGINARQWAKDMQEAHRTGVLAIRHYGSRAPMRPCNAHPSASIPALWTANQDAARDFLDLVLVADINAWLKAKQVGYGFPPASVAKTEVHQSSFSASLSDWHSSSRKTITVFEALNIVTSEATYPATVDVWQNTKTGELTSTLTDGKGLAKMRAHDDFLAYCKAENVNPVNPYQRWAKDYDGSEAKGFYEVTVAEFLKFAEAYGITEDPVKACFDEAKARGAQPKTEQDRQSVPGRGVKEARQSHRYQMCIDAKLAMPKDDYGPMPRGIGALAKKLGITRQAFTEDVKAHIARLNGK